MIRPHHVFYLERLKNRAGNVSVFTNCSLMFHVRPFGPSADGREVNLVSNRDDIIWFVRFDETTESSYFGWVMIRYLKVRDYDYFFHTCPIYPAKKE